MLLNTYNPDAEARCPKCEKVVKCKNLGGNLAFYPRYLEMYHEKCGTEWRVELERHPEDGV